jgi:hypothetical protein
MEDMEVTIRQFEQQNLQLAKKNENLEAENRLLVKKTQNILKNLSPFHLIDGGRVKGEAGGE